MRIQDVMERPAETAAPGAASGTMPPLIESGNDDARVGLLAFLRRSPILALLSTPIIYSLAVPLVLLDLWVTVYQWTCFPIYGIARVRRRRYFVIDRHKLPYLNAIEKVHCAYCSYANGLLSYVREVAARTEQYWCPIRHKRAIPTPHSRYRRFFEYGDGAGYRRGLPDLRRQLAPRPKRPRRAPEDRPADAQ